MEEQEMKLKMKGKPDYTIDAGEFDNMNNPKAHGRVSIFTGNQDACPGPVIRIWEARGVAWYRDADGKLHAVEGKMCWYFPEEWEETAAVDSENLPWEEERYQYFIANGDHVAEDDPVYEIEWFMENIV